jgi:hypothetical protein
MGLDHRSVAALEVSVSCKRRMLPYGFLEVDAPAWRRLRALVAWRHAHNGERTVGVGASQQRQPTTTSHQATTPQRNDVDSPSAAWGPAKGTSTPPNAHTPGSTQGERRRTGRRAAKSHTQKRDAADLGIRSAAFSGRRTELSPIGYRHRIDPPREIFNVYQYQSFAQYDRRRLFGKEALGRGLCAEDRPVFEKRA